MIRWFTKFFAPSPSCSSTGSTTEQALTRLEELLRVPGRAHYATLLTLAHTTLKDNFTATVHCPSLVGSAIRDGDLGPSTISSRDMLGNSTFYFSPAQISQFLEGSPVEQTVFLLRKEPNKTNPSPTHRFTIGRSKNNDIRIVDFAISRSHAVIEYGPDGYSIVDCGSRNGAKVNGKTVRRVAERLYDGAIITLGRYEFTFLMPGTLYERLRRIPFTPQTTLGSPEKSPDSVSEE